MQGYVGYEYQFIIVLRKYKRNNSAKVSNKGSESKRGTGCRNPELSSGIQAGNGMQKSGVVKW